MRFSLCILICLIFLTACGQKKDLKKRIPEKPIGWVSDFEKVFTGEQVNTLDSIIGRHESKTTNQIAIVTLDLDSTSIVTFDELEELTKLLFNQWGIGQKDKNNGVLILFSKRLRKIRIQTGQGLIDKLTDEEAKSFIDKLVIPNFKQSNYFEGTYKCLEAVIKEIE